MILGNKGISKMMFCHIYVLNKNAARHMGPGLHACARLSHSNGRFMEAYTNQPAVVLYTGDYIPALKGKDGASYTKRQGVALETQAYPDSICVDDEEHAEFAKGQCHILRPGGPSYFS